MLVLLFLLFLIPVAVYCLVLAGINRRLHPVLVSGLWDCIGLLFAASGFFLGVLPGTVTLLYAKTLRQLPFVEPRAGVEALGNLWLKWWGVLLLYYVALAAGAIALVLYRRGTTVIYNINPEDWERLFARVLAKLGMEQARSGKQIALGALPPATDDALAMGLGGAAEAVIQAKALPRLALERTALLYVDAFPALSNVTLHWEHAGAELREEIETELAKAMPTVETMDNAAASWFLGIGGSILIMVFLTVVVLVILSLPRRW